MQQEQELTSTGRTQTFQSTKNLSARIQKFFIANEKRFEECEAAYNQQQAEIAKQEAEARRLADIKRLGGVRQYEDFKAENYTNTPVLNAMKNYPQENYYLWGIAGSGKTHAAVAVAREVPNVRVIRMAEISRLFRKDISAEQEERYLEQLATIPLVLDDLGAEKMTDYLRGILFEIIDRRWSNRTGGLIITANLNLPQLAGIVGDRTISRLVGLIGANVINIKGADHRMEFL